MAGDCGDCTMCCKLFRIKAPTLDKPKNEWCVHCHVGKGCMIYESRPAPCRDFECLWLQSQDKGAAKFALHLRPDKSKVMLMASPGGTFIVGMVDPARPVAWQEPRVLHHLASIAAQRIPVLVSGPDGNWFFEPDGRVYEVDLGPEDEDGMQPVIGKTKGGRKFKIGAG